MTLRFRCYVQEEDDEELEHDEEEEDEEEERAHLPATSTVMVTWLPSITLRSLRPFRKTGAVGLLGSTAGAALVLLTLGFSAIEKQNGQSILWLRGKIITHLQYNSPLAI